MTGPARCGVDAAGHCSVCGDDAVVMTVVALDAAACMATALHAAGRESVALDLVDGVRVGDRVLVHLGFALQRLEAGA